MNRFNFFQHRNKHYFDPCWQETFAQHLILKIVLSNILSFGCIWRFKRFARYFNSFVSSGFRMLEKSEMVNMFLMWPSLGSLDISFFKFHFLDWHWRGGGAQNRRTFWTFANGRGPSCGSNLSVQVNLT